RARRRRNRRGPGPRPRQAGIAADAPAQDDPCLDAEDGHHRAQRRVGGMEAHDAGLPVIGIQAGFVLGGAVYIETVFQWPGIGAMLVQAISTRDILLVQGGVLLVAASYVLFNLAADVAQSSLDPRLRR